MYKGKDILIPLLAICVVLFIGYDGFGWNTSFKNKEIEKVTSLLDFSNSSKQEVWAVFQNYLKFARTHNLAGIKSLSHQISATCNDPAREKECFALMDSVYAFASPFQLNQFKHIQEDERQIIMYTDGPTVAILYFTKDANDTLKVLGMRFCLEDETSTINCVETDPDKRDLDRNGWWDSVESLFYNDLRK